MDHFPFTHNYALLFWTNIFYIINALFSVFTEIELVFFHVLYLHFQIAEVYKVVLPLLCIQLSQHLNGGKVFFSTI